MSLYANLPYKVADISLADFGRKVSAPPSAAALARRRTFASLPDAHNRKSTLPRLRCQA